MRTSFRLLAFAVATAACGGGSHETAKNSGTVVAIVHTEALTTGTQITRVKADISPSGLTADLARNADGSFGAVLTLPVGLQTLSVTVYAGTAVVGTGAASVSVQANATAQVSLTIVDQTGPAPMPLPGPVITAIVASKTSPVIGESITLTALALSPQGAAIAYAWTVDCAGGSFTAPTAPTTNWSSTAAGACALTLTVTSAGLTDARSVSILVVAAGTTTGSVSVSGSFVPRTTIETVALFPSPSSTVPGCQVSRTGTDATCRTAAAAGQVLGVTFDGGAVGTASYTLRDACGGTAAPGASASSFRWTAPSAGGFCVLTATKVDGGINDTFTFGLYVDPIGDESSRQEFDWTPDVASVTVPHAFVERPTTTAHIVWNGSTFADTRGRITFVPQGALPSVASVGFWGPPEMLVGPWPTGATRFIADAEHGANAVDTSGDFTVCAKFKPGAHPGVTNPNKILIAKGQAEFPTQAWPEGWALMQMHEAYCFHYLIAGSGATMSPDTAVTSEAVDQFTYDYMCGGRAGSSIVAGAHGRSTGAATTVTATFANESGLPLSIGAYPAGDDPELDGGLYEVIFDSRPATADTFNDIVAAAEGYRLPNGAAYQSLYSPGTAARGADGSIYTLPPYANTGTWPVVVLDHTVPGNAGIRYRAPLAEDTRTTGYCIGAEIVADGAWPVGGGIVLSFIDDAGTQLTRLDIDPRLCFATVAGGESTNSCSTGYPNYAAWAVGSRHTFKGCIDPARRVLQGFVDGETTSILPGDAGPVPDLSHGVLTIGSSLSGARVARVFACPFADRARCN